MTGRYYAVRRLKRLSHVLVLILTAGCFEVGPAVSSGDRAPDAPPQQVPLPAPVEPFESDNLVEAVHDRINAYRESQGLEALELDDDVSRLAEEHSRRMASGQVPLGHSGFEDRAGTIRREGAVQSLAENVGYNRGVADPAADTVARWLNSPGHRENVVGHYETTGIGVAMNARGAFYFTQIFVEPAE